MRIALSTLTVLALLLGAFALASGDEPAGAPAAKVTPDAFKALSAKVEALQMEVQYLRSREDALRTYVLANEQRAQGLATVVSRARRAGFEARTIPVDSRKILMDGLLAAAQGFVRGLPKISREEAGMLKDIAKLRKAAGLDN